MIPESIILSVHPEFAEQILNGEKIWEYRRRWGIQPVRKVYIYATAPVKRIVGTCIFTRMLKGHPRMIWNQTHQRGGIDGMRYDDYFGEHPIAYALQLNNAQRLLKPIDPREYEANWRPPQSHAYFDLDRLTKGGRA